MGQQELIDILEENPWRTIKELEEMLGQGRSSVSILLGKLKKQGIVQVRKSKKLDARKEWALN